MQLVECKTSIRNPKSDWNYVLGSAGRTRLEIQIWELSATKSWIRRTYTAKKQKVQEIGPWRLFTPRRQRKKQKLRK